MPREFKQTTELRKSLAALIEAFENEGIDLVNANEHGRAQELFTVRKRVIDAAYKPEV